MTTADLDYAALHRGYPSTVFGCSAGALHRELREDEIALQPIRFRCLSTGGQITTPLPLLQFANHLRPKRVKDDVACQFKQVAVFVDQYRLEAALKNMADALVSPVKALRVYAIQLAHAFAEIGIRRFNHHVIVISHQAVGVTNPIETLTDLGERFEPRYAIIIGQIDVLAPVTARCDVVKRTGEFESEGAGHDVMSLAWNCDNERPDPFGA